MAGKQNIRESAHEELRKAKDQLEALEEEKSRLLDELEEMKKVAADANLRLCEVLVAQQENEKCRLDELEHASFESAQKRDQAWQLELEAVQKQRDLDVQALASAAKELNRVNDELSLAVEAKNRAVNESMEAKIASESYAKRVRVLSTELYSLRDLLETSAAAAAVDTPTPDQETAASDSDEDESEEESDESDASETSAALTASVISLIKVQLKRAKSVEARLAEKENLAEELQMQLDSARVSESRIKNLLSESKMRIETLQLELERSNKSETQSFESLIALTKQLEETKMSLEESKYKIVSLHHNIESMEVSFGLNSREPNASSHRSVETAKLDMQAMEQTVKGFESQLRTAKEELDSALVREEAEIAKASALITEISQLKNQLALATEAEEQSRKAMDDLALVLKEVMTEATEVKRQLWTTQTEVETARAETEHTKLVLKNTEARFQGLLEEARAEIKRMEEAAERLKLEAEESHTAWNGKEVGFVHCMKMSEEEIADVKAENDMLIESLKEAEMAAKMAREESGRLRDILKHALNEATVAKEGAEIARTENSQLKDNLAEMGNALVRLTQENELLRSREAAFEHSHSGELKSSMVPKPSSRRSISCLPVHKGWEMRHHGSHKKNHHGGVKESKDSDDERKRQEILRQEYINQRIKQGYNDDDIDPELFKGSIFDIADSPDHDDAFGGFNGAVRRKGPPSTLTDDEETAGSDEMDNVDGGSHYDTGSNRSSEVSQRKKKALIRRFGDMLRRRSYA